MNVIHTCTLLVSTLDHLKNDQRGVLGPRAVAANSHPLSAHFCCVDALHVYYLAYPPKPNTLGLSSHGSSVQWVDMRRLCTAVTIAPTCTSHISIWRASPY